MSVQLGPYRAYLWVKVGKILKGETIVICERPTYSTTQGLTKSPIMWA